MAVKLEGQVSKKQVRQISRRPELAQGFYALLPVQVIRKESEDTHLSIMVRFNPLRDPEDANSVDKSYSVFANIVPPFPNPLNPDCVPENWMVDKSAKFISALFDELASPVEWVNKMPVVDGEAVSKKDVDELNDAAIAAALEYSQELWNLEDDELEEVIKSNMVICKRSYYDRNGVERSTEKFFRNLPADVELLDSSEWEYYPNCED